MNQALTRFINQANRFSSNVTITREQNTVSAKSLLGVLSLRLEPGMEVVLAAEGPDEREAAEGLAKLLA